MLKGKYSFAHKIKFACCRNQDFLQVLVWHIYNMNEIIACYNWLSVSNYYMYEMLEIFESIIYTSMSNNSMDAEL